MDSPGHIDFTSLIQLDREKADPLYLQIAKQLSQAVHAGKLQRGMKIPGSRILANELQVHRKTVVAALEELKDQGWLRSIPSVGTYTHDPTVENDTFYHDLSSIDDLIISLRKNFVLDLHPQIEEFPLRFTDGVPDYRSAKMTELFRIYTSALRAQNVIKKMTRNENNPFFEQQLLSYVNSELGINLAETNLLSVQNKEIALYIISQVLVQKGDLILVAEYSYPLANMVFRQASATIKTIPLDQEGISINYIKENFRRGEIQYLYIQPDHQYPTTTSLSNARRDALIRLSQDYRFTIIEDGTGTEISFEKISTTSLLIRSRGKHLLYLGNFGGFLPAEFQTAYFIASSEIIAEAKKYVQLFGRTDYLKAQAFAEMISTGDIHRFRRRALKTFHERRAQFSALLQENFNQLFHFTEPEGGLAFWLEVTTKISLFALRDKAMKLGLFIPMTCLYQDQRKTALRLGYANLTEPEMETLLLLLKRAFQELHQSS